MIVIPTIHVLQECVFVEGDTLYLAPTSETALSSPTASANCFPPKQGDRCPGCRVTARTAMQMVLSGHAEIVAERDIDADRDIDEEEPR